MALMNRVEKIAFIKREVRELENQEQLFNQGLSSITSRKRYLELELAELGAVNSPLGVLNTVMYYQINND